MQFPATLDFVAEKPPPHGQTGKIFYTGSIHFMQCPATLDFVAEKPPSPQRPNRGKFFYTGSIHFMQFPATLDFVAEKPPHIQTGKNCLHWIYPFHAISSNFGFCGRKVPPQWLNRENFFTLVLSISCNFKQLWILWQKSPPASKQGNFFYTGSIHFMQFPVTLDFVAEKSPPPSGWTGKFFYTGSIHFMQCPATLDFVAEKPPHPGSGKFFLHWIYPFQAISSNFGFCGRKAPPQRLSREKNFYTGSIHFMQFPPTLDFVAEKPPPPMVKQGKNLHWIYPFHAISSNFGFCGRKAPPPSGQTGKKILHCIYPFHAISGNFGFCSRKASPSGQTGKKLFTLDLSISCNFQQLWILWQKSPPHDQTGKNYILISLLSL